MSARTSSDYVRRLDERPAARRLRAARSIMMGSNGGVLLGRAHRAASRSRWWNPGPIGGCIGAGVYAEALGFHNVIAFDMGGTTAKCALVENGRFEVEVGLLCRRHRARLPDQGAGLRHRRGRLRRRLDRLARRADSACMSGRRAPARRRGRCAMAAAASSRPSPMPISCSAGIDATSFPRRRAAARRGGCAPTRSRTASREPLGYTGEAGARSRSRDGILALATVTMAGAIRRISIERGLDPREFVLFCYGGGGPLHAAALARELNIPDVVIPPEPGNFSAIGMLLADARIDESQHLPARCSTTATVAEIERGLRGDGSSDAREALNAISAPRGRLRASSPRCAFAASATTSRCRSRRGSRCSVRSVAAFERDYQAPLRPRRSTAPASSQALHVSAFAPARSAGSRAACARQRGPAPRAPSGGWSISASDGGMVDDTRSAIAIALPPGFAAPGPAVIEEYGSTTVVGPGDRFEIGTLGEIRIDCGSEATDMAIDTIAPRRSAARRPDHRRVIRHGVCSRSPTRSTRTSRARPSARSSTSTRITRSASSIAEGG